MMHEPTERQTAFAKYLQGFAERQERGVLAALRRGLGKPPGTVPDMFPYVLPLLSGLTSDSAQAPYFLVAALFAWHPSTTGGGNLGDTFRAIAAGKRDEAKKSTERRFVALLNAHVDDLADHLRHAIGLARSADVPVNYAQLLHDVQYWTDEKRSVQREWAKRFWRDRDEQGEGIATDKAAVEADH